MKFIFPIIALISLAGLYVFLPQIPLWPWFHNPPSDYDKLVLENESLRAQLLETRNKRQEAEDKDGKYLRAKVYSTYPFNDKNIFIINVGKSSGVNEGDAVLAEKGILLGRIEKIFNNYSEVKSIFSPNWQSPVKIGDKGYDGLLIGDPDPKVTMIVGDKEVAVGEDVYSVSKEFSYGLKIGKVKSVESGSSNFFKEATIDLPYKFNNLLEVIVIKNNVAD